MQIGSLQKVDQASTLWQGALGSRPVPPQLRAASGSMSGPVFEPGRFDATVGDEISPRPSGAGQNSGDADEVRKAFNSFVGQTFFSQMLSSMRKTVGRPAYFHGGQAEEVFRGQLDQVLSEKMTEASGAAFSDRLFKQQFPALA